MTMHMMEPLPGQLSAVISEVHGYEVGLEGLDVTVHFRDREREIEMLFTDLLKHRGVSLIYGPRGAGKSTLIEVVVRGVKRLGGFGNYAFTHFHFDEGVIRELQIHLPGLSNEVINELRGALMLEVGLDPIRFTVKMENIIDTIAKMLERYRLGDKMVVVFFDDIDKYTEMYGHGVLEAVVNAVSDVTRRRNASMKVIFMVSDQVAVNAINRVGPKGGLSPYLLWNLPRKAFEDVVGEVSERLGVRDVDIDLLWRLIGGNVRELAVLIGRYNWDVKSWLQGEIVKMIRYAFDDYRVVRGLGKPSDVLKKMIEDGNSAVREYGLDEFNGQPDIVRNDYGLLEKNIIINVGLPRVTHLSELPSEPWVGRDYAYQIPAYYWALRAMIERRSINVTPEEILRIISTSTSTR